MPRGGGSAINACVWIFRFRVSLPFAGCGQLPDRSAKRLRELLETGRSGAGEA